MGILWCPKRGCKAPESSNWVINQYVSFHITSLIWENEVLRTYFQRSQDPTTSNQVVFQMLQCPANWALRTFAKMLTKDYKVFSGHPVLKTELLCVYTFLKAQCFGDSPYYLNISVRRLVVVIDNNWKYLNIKWHLMLSQTYCKSISVIKIWKESHTLWNLLNQTTAGKNECQVTSVLQG